MTKLICLMPTYNKEKILARAIESVMMQKTDFDYKLIILDDCSSDGSYLIAKQYKEKFANKIDIIRNSTNLKLLKTIAQGYKCLKGADYFCVLDADDYYTYDKKFAEAVSFLDGHKNYSMYMTNVMKKTENSEIPWYGGRAKYLDFNFFDRKTNNGYFIQTSGVVYRNIYFKSGENKQFENVFNLTFPECFRADGFRYEWYLKAGRAYFKNNVQSVYDYNCNGVWSSLSQAEQLLMSAKLYYSCAEFFPDEKFYYIAFAREKFEDALRLFKKLPDEIYLKNKDEVLNLMLLLMQRQENFASKVQKFFINLFPDKKIRILFRRQLLR